jgi:hypothetical protein
MWSPAEISAGTGRLTANKLTPSDVKTLTGIFKLYLKSLAGSQSFSDLSARLAAASDADGSKTASKLAATLINLEEKGFKLAELKGGRSGLQTNVAGEMVLKIRLALTLLDYDLPEEFSGAVENGSENFGDSIGFVLPSVVIRTKPGW